MSKLFKLCCTEPPEISLNITCACCEGHIEKVEAKDEVDSNETEEIDERVANDAETEDVTCCCFRRKRQAKLKRKKKSSDGSKT